MKTKYLLPLVLVVLVLACDFNPYDVFFQNHEVDDLGVIDDTITYGFALSTAYVGDAFWRIAFRVPENATYTLHLRSDEDYGNVKLYTNTWDEVPQISAGTEKYALESGVDYDMVAYQGSYYGKMIEWTLYRSE